MRRLLQRTMHLAFAHQNTTVPLPYMTSPVCHATDLRPGVDAATPTHIGRQRRQRGVTRWPNGASVTSPASVFTQPFTIATARLRSAASKNSLATVHPSPFRLPAAHHHDHDTSSSGNATGGPARPSAAG